MEIRQITPNELDRALALVERVFMRFEAPEYSRQGIDTFLAFLQNAEAVGALTIYGAFWEGTLAGVLATRGNSHIALFFVEAESQGKGVGRALFSAAAACAGDVMTVNSSPYAVEIYRHLGFVPLSGEQVTDGIRFTPMKCILRKEQEPL
ncbi:MAG: GNAT family N-acetyltransferase [Clostridiales bacterium]|nr:GNAT family N-acetyltransferase [Clostridiales bacterium]